MNGTGVEHHPERTIHKWTVWVRSKVVAFCATEQAARAILKAERARKHP